MGVLKCVDWLRWRGKEVVVDVSGERSPAMSTAAPRDTTTLTHCFHDLKLSSAEAKFPTRLILENCNSHIQDRCFWGQSYASKPAKDTEISDSLSNSLILGSPNLMGLDLEM